MKTHDKKEDFIKIISMMNNNELNEYIKNHGPNPKPVVMVRIVDKDKSRNST